MASVLCRVPKTGLGNQLFPIVKAHVFGALNNLPVVVTGYRQFKIGPYLRGERSKRNYSNYFTFQKNIVSAWFEERSIQALAKKTVIAEPPVEKLKGSERKEGVYFFSEHPHYHDYFAGLRENRDEARKQLWRILRKDILDEVESKPSPVIGVHIRMGDFKKLKEGEDFKQVGATRTPEKIFIDCINTIRSINGSTLPVSIFTDGYKNELKDLLTLKDVEIVEGNRDIVDLLLLSKSKIIVTSAGSTFSYWAGFLADAPVILHTGHIYAPLRPQSVNNKFYEGPLGLDSQSELLIKNIVAINSKALPV